MLVGVKPAESGNVQGMYLDSKLGMRLVFGALVGVRVGGVRTSIGVAARDGALSADESVYMASKKYGAGVRAASDGSLAWRDACTA